MDTVLIADNIHATYSRKDVLHGVSVTVGRGEIVGVIGPNGAGKSTLLKALCGFLRAKSGRVVFDGRDVTGLSLCDHAKSGMAYLIQGGAVFQSLSVEENLNLAASVNGRGNGTGRLEVVLGVLPDLRKVLRRRAALLSAGQRQMLAIGMVLMNQHANLLLLLDEPLAGLAPGVVDTVLSALLHLKEHIGVSMMVVEQNIRAALAVSSRIYLLRGGVVVSENRPDAISHAGIEEAYFG